MSLTSLFDNYPSKRSITGQLFPTKAIFVAGWPGIFCWLCGKRRDAGSLPSPSSPCFNKYSGDGPYALFSLFNTKNALA